MPQLSVLLPVRNGEPTISTAVRSTLRAMPADAELVVLDDASTDGTADALDRIRDRRLRVLHSSDGLGVTGGLNRLLADTDSELVARMDADDECLPWRFRTQLRALGDGPRGAEVVFTTVVPWRQGRRLQRPDGPIPISPRAFPLHLLVTNPASHPAMAAHRRVIDAVRGYRDVPSEDYDLWLRLATAGTRLRRLATWGLKYAVHDAQITASADWRNRSWADPAIATAYRELHEQVLGRPGRRLVAIASDGTIPPVDRAVEATAFLDDLAAAAGSLPAPSRRFLLTKARRRWETLAATISP